MPTYIAKVKVKKDGKTKTVIINAPSMTDAEKEVNRGAEKGDEVITIDRRWEDQ